MSTKTTSGTRDTGGPGRLLRAPAVALTGIFLAALIVALMPAPSTAQVPVAFFVDSVADDSDVDAGDGACATAFGACTLRAAIEEANALPGLNEVHFPMTWPDLPPGTPFWLSIQPATPLPPITSPIVIDGTTNSVYGGMPVVELNGSGTSAGHGLEIRSMAANGSTIRGLAINRFNGEGILIEGSDFNVIQSNFVGTDPTGTVDVGNGLSGIYLRYASNNRVEYNVVSGNEGWAGVTICGNEVHCGGGIPSSIGATDNVIRANKIGTDISGTAPLGNAQRGVSVDGTGGNLIGGTATGDGNVISANGQNGLVLSSTSENTVAGNYIGVSADGTGSLGNFPHGVVIAGDKNTIGPGNVIANSTQHGIVLIGPAIENAITRNSIHSNGGAGIVNADGANLGLTPPVITEAGAIISGTSCAGCTVEVFSDAEDEGRAVEGTVTAGPDGSWTFLPAVTCCPEAYLISFPNITATATDSAGNTSQFSAPLAFTLPSGAEIANVALTVAESETPAGAGVVPIANIPIEAIPLSDVLPSTALAGTDLRQSPLSSIPLSSIPLSSIPLSSIPLSSIPLSSIPIYAAGGWEEILKGTSLQGVPLQNVNLEDLLALNPAPDGLQALTLAEIDLSSTALRGIGIASIALGATPLSSIPIPPYSGNSYQDWCDALAVAGYPCASLGITQSTVNSTSLLALNLQGVPLSSIPLSSIPLSSIDLAASPLSSIPLSSIPLSSIPLSSIPLSSIPLSSIPLSSIPLSSIPLSSIPLSSITLPAGYASFCAFFDTGAVSCSSLGVSDASTLDDLLSALEAVNGDLASTPLSSIPLSSIPLSSIPLSSIPLSSIPLSSIPLSSIPLSSITLPGSYTSFCEYFDTESTTETCASLGLDSDASLGDLILALEAAGVDPASTPLGSIPLSSIPLSSPLSSIPLSSIPLSSIPLSSIPLSSIPLSSISIAGTPLSSIPLSSIDIAGSPLSSIPLSSIPLSSIMLAQSPLSSIPLSSIGNVVNCSLVNCSTATLGDAADAGAILPGAVLNDIAAALSGFTLGDLQAYGSASVADIIAALAGVSSEDVQFSLSIFFGDLLIGDANDWVNLGDVTLGQILIALLIRADYPWEELPLGDIGVQDYAVGGPVLNYQVSFDLVGAGEADVSVIVDLPAGFRYVPGSAQFANLPVPPGELSPLPAYPPNPYVEGSTLSFSIPGGLPADAHATLLFQARPGLRLGTFSSDVTVVIPSMNVAATNRAPVTVTENFEVNDDPATAGAVISDNLYISHISSAGDLDFYQIPAPPLPGSRIAVYLSHQSHDGDLVMYRPGAAPLRESDGAPIGTPLDDAPEDLTGAQAPPPETLQDIPLSSIPLSSISANRGTSDESTAALSQDGGGYYTIQVSGYNGSFSEDPYVLRVRVTSPPPAPQCAARTFPGEGVAGTVPSSIDGNVNTLFLVNKKRLGDFYGAAAADNVMTALSTLAARSDLGVNGAVLSVEADANVAAKFTEWDKTPCSPTAANDVVAAINALVDSYRATLPNLEYIVLVGSDEIVPMARIPDLTRVANESSYANDVLMASGSNASYASFVTSNMLSDNPYADFDPIPWLNRQLFVPDIAVGRLVETPPQIVTQINHYIGFNGTLDLNTALSTGYDFLMDGAEEVAQELDAVVAPDSATRLNDDWWTRDDLLDAFLGAADPPDIASVNAHYDHYRALPADGNSTGDESDLFTTADLRDLPAAPGNLAGHVIFSMGCHSALNLANVLVALPTADQRTRLFDWPEAYAEREAAVVLGNTGYGYGDTVVVAYTERLMQLFASKLDGTMSIGQALTFAKQDYLGGLVQYETYDEKVIAIATFYGLPMFKVGEPVSPPTPPAAVPLSVDPATGLASAAISVSPNFNLVDTGERGKYYSADDGAEATSGRPVQPVVQVDLPKSADGEVAHGVMLTGLESFNDEEFDAVFSYPAFDLSVEERPSEVIFPASIHNLTTYNTPDGQRQKLVLMPGQYFPDEETGLGVGTQRLYTSIEAVVLYSDSSDFTPPTFRNTSGLLVDSTATFVAEVSDDVAGNVTRVLVLYRAAGSSTWSSLDLVNTAGSDRWSGSVEVAGEFEYMAFASDAAGNVGSTTNKGEFHQGVPLPPPPSTGMTISVEGTAAPSGGQWLTDATVSIQGDATVIWEYRVDGSAYQRYSAPFAVTGDGAHVVDVRGSDGSHGQAAVLIDTTAPVITITSPAEGGSVLLNESVTPVYSCADAGSGVASCTASALDTSKLGTASFTVTAVDVAGHSSSLTRTYLVAYDFNGFLSPVENAPTVNVAKAGSSVPLKWQLMDAAGAYTSVYGAVTYIGSWSVSCEARAASSDVPETALASGSSGLTYDSTENQYVYAWKSQKQWRDTCRRFGLQVDDGTWHYAEFRFK